MAIAGSPPGAVSTPYQTRIVVVARTTDGIVIRGRWRAHVAIGAPRVTIFASEMAQRAIGVNRAGRTLTVSNIAAAPTKRAPELRVTLPRLRGIATSGAVVVTIEDRSDAPLFLDLAGTGSARARGGVPLLRVTASGSVDADLAAMPATALRVHARQDSRLAITATTTLTIVALDAARVRYRGPSRVGVDRRNGAVVGRF
jgi:hypothetical protein